MTCKNAFAGLDLGGGKAVLIDDGQWERREERMRAFGALLERLGGRYITAEDVGATPHDMETIAEVTDHVAGRPGGQGDPSAATARTVFGAIRNTAAIELGRGLDELTVGVLGVGHVGARLVKLLRAAGAHVMRRDLEPAHIAADICGFDQAEVNSRIEAAISQTQRVLEEAHATAVSPLMIAHRLVDRRLARRSPSTVITTSF